MNTTTTKRYTLHENGPDDHSTYAHCFGPNAGLGAITAQADRLADLAPVVDDLSHSNWSVRDRHRHATICPGEFWARKCVRKARPAVEL